MLFFTAAAVTAGALCLRRLARQAAQQLSEAAALAQAEGEVLAFVGSALQECALPATFTSPQRRRCHRVAEIFRCGHSTLGEAPNSWVQLTRASPPLLEAEARVLHEELKALHQREAQLQAELQHHERNPFALLQRLVPWVFFPPPVTRTPSRAPPGDLRIIAMTNKGQLPMLRNMLRSAAEVGMDLGLFDVYLTPEEAPLAGAAAFGSGQFTSITALKLALIARESAAHASVLWVDNDIVFFSNPLDDLLARAPVPLLMQNDGWSPCTGFWLLRRGSGEAAEVLAHSLRVMARGGRDGRNDQSAFAAALQERRPPIAPTLLEEAKYPNGEVYFELGVTRKALMVHCNFLRTTEEKVARLKAHGMWRDDEGILGKVRVLQLKAGELTLPRAEN